MNGLDPRIMAIDPGESTGLAWTRLVAVGMNYSTTVAPNHENVYEAIQSIKPKILIVEWFITGQRLNQFSRRTIELCGACRALAYIMGSELIVHTPKTRYPGMDEAERILIQQHGPRGTTVKGRGAWTDHQQDALAHLLVYEITHAMKARFSLPPNSEPARSRGTPPRR